MVLVFLVTYIKDLNVISQILVNIISLMILCRYKHLSYSIVVFAIITIKIDSSAKTIVNTTLVFDIRGHLY